ncbi:Sodium/hydrogen exchanger [Aphelenchoides fujianensis]|nr:Sodium/hydrogen exchanger [Aphelenchoides fujianensis]
MKADAIQYTPSANLTLSIVRKKFQRNGRNPNGLAVARGLSVEQDAVLQRIDEVLHLEEKQYRLRNSSFYDHDASIRLPDLLSRPSIMGEASKYSLVEKWPSRPSNVVLSFEDFRKFGIKFWFYADMYLSIEYMKTLPVFKHLCFDDQLAVCFTNVLKDSMLVASYYSFQKGVEDVIIYPDNWVAFQQHDVSSSLIEIEKEIRRGVVPEICLLRPDKIEFSLLRMIGALNYTCVDGLSEAAQERLEVDCSRYQSALLVYLQNKYGLNGTRRFAELLALLALVSQRIRFNHEYFALKQCILKIPSPSTLFVEIMSKQLVPIDA